jgi:hypothetical protein
MFDVDDPTMLSHFIVGAALYMFDNKYGTFINCLGVSLNGNPEVCTLSDRFFVELSNYNLLLETSTFRGFGLGTFLLSTLQVLGSLGYKALTVVPFQPFHLNCHKGGQYQVFTHHLYLQARIEHGSAYSPECCSRMTSLCVPTTENIVLSTLTKNQRSSRKATILMTNLCAYWF